MDRKRTGSGLLAAAIILAAVVISYGNSLENVFQYDDYHIIARNPSVRSLSAAVSSLIDPRAFSLYQTPMIRAIPLISYAANYAIEGFNLRGWHLFNLFLHFITALLLRSFVIEMLRKRGREETAGTAGTVCALIFAVHPLQSEAINYMSARSILLMAVFYMSSVYLHLSAGSLLRRGVSWFMFVMAMLCREDAATLPAIIVMVDLYARTGAGDAGGGKASSIRSKIAAWAPYWALLGIYFLYRRVSLGTTISGDFVRPVSENLLLQIEAVGLYQKLFIWPEGFSISHPMPHSIIGSAFWVASLIVIIVEVVAALLGFRKRSMISFSIGWYFILISPAALIPLNMVASEHRNYMAMAGMSMLAGVPLGGLVSRIGRRGKLFKYLATASAMALILVAAMLTRERNMDWRTEKALWKSASEVHPDDSMAWDRLGVAYKDERNYQMAEDAYRRSIEVEPSTEAYNNLSHVCAIKGDADCAKSAIQMSLKLNPNNPNALYNLAAYYIMGSDYVSAEGAYRKAVQLRPVFPEAHRNLGILLMTRSEGKTKEALEHLILSFKQDPYQQDAEDLKKVIKRLQDDLSHGERQ